MRIVALALLFAACGHAPKPTPVPPQPIGDASCETACAHMNALGCEAGKPTPNGATCVEVCDNIVTSGIVTWALDCMVVAPTCRDVDMCNP